MEEIRRRILHCVIWFCFFSALSYYFVDPILNWLAKPVGEFVFTAPTEALFVRFKIAFGCGAIAAFPFFLFHGWRYAEVALRTRERSFLLFILPFSCGLFFVGAALALFVIVPIASKTLLQFGSPALRPMISIGSYLSFLFWMILGFGILFQLPLAVGALSAANIVPAETFARYRKHVIVGIVVAAAVLTPGPDILSQFLLCLPTYLLFEISLFASRLFKKRHET